MLLHRIRISLNQIKLTNVQYRTTLIRQSFVKTQLDELVHQQLENEEIKPRKHIGINKAKTSTLPTKILQAMEKVTGDIPIKKLIDSGAVLDRYLLARKPPLEKYDLKKKLKELTKEVENDPVKHRLPEVPPDPANEMSTTFYNEMKRQRIESLARTRIYAWQAIEYDEYKSLLYLFGRAAQEYGVIMRIFQEIKKRTPDFQPRSFFDFGSGVGTGLWAASELWMSSIYEYYLVDCSKYMNDLSDLILRDGNVNKNISLKNVNFRQFLPSRDTQYDVVLSAYSMFEQQTLKSRLEIANNLWNKTAHDGFLVFIENGSNSGFQIIDEIRQFLIDFNAKNQVDGFIFSPCPHELTCPRRMKNDKPCNFEIKYTTLPFSGSVQIRTHHYSYLVIKKAKSNESSDHWPRVVRPTLIRCRHVICRLCTSKGALEDATFTKSKHEKFVYRCARHVNWGDQYPTNSFEVIPNPKKNKNKADNKSDE